MCVCFFSFWLAFFLVTSACMRRLFISTDILNTSIVSLYLFGCQDIIETTFTMQLGWHFLTVRINTNCGWYRKMKASPPFSSFCLQLVTCITFSLSLFSWRYSSLFLFVSSLYPTYDIFAQLHIFLSALADFTMPYFPSAFICVSKWCKVLLFSDIFFERAIEFTEFPSIISFFSR